MVTVYVSMFAPDATLLDWTTFKIKEEVLGKPPMLAAIARHYAGKLTRPEGLDNPQILLTTERLPTADEFRAREALAESTSVVLG